MTGAPFLDGQYNPSEIESRWARYWVEESLYRADPKAPGEPYAVVIPPPNVTGVLHMGHALNATLQDILVRTARMRGKNVLWVVGTDHAGIATQNVVERQLAAENRKRADLGREAFVEKVWQWRGESGGKIIAQLKRLGASCDFTRERFTMDEGLSKAVREAFVDLFEAGLITRAEHLINWCPRCQTALSDLEVEHEEKDGHLWPLQYPVVGPGIGAGERITVSTTRPETYLGDTAVAVHPDDERYAHLVGKEIELPLIKRRIPIVADASVDREFGTGAVKITPAHDFNDFELGNRHGLPRITILNADGSLNAEAGIYAGLDRSAARNRVIQDLTAAGFIDESAVVKHVHQVGHCYRCRTVVEPYLSLQWFVKAKPLAEQAMAAVRKGDTTFFPENWEKTYFQWLENIRDWCISRQIWWGHQIPAWYCKEGHVTVSRQDPLACGACGGAPLVRDPDVLDTWFSSSLWPFSTLGWPEGGWAQHAAPLPQNDEHLLKRYYPTAVLVTAFDIIFFWVARMMMMGLHCMKEVPFRHIYIHALVRDAYGQKMSKSKGNVVDPLAIMDRYGTDAFRFTLAALAAQGRDIRLDEARIEGYRHFINKVWNATRFVLRYLPQGQDPSQMQKLSGHGSAFAPNHWIRSRLRVAIGAVDAALDRYEFNVAALALYHFFWDEFCAWYIEWIKPILNDAAHPQREETLANAVAVLEASLRLLHPFIPFVTEEIWQRLGPCLGETGKSISLTRMPRQDDPALAHDEAKVREAEQVLLIIEGIRALRGENRIPAGQKIRVHLVGTSEIIFKAYEAMMKQMAGISALEYAPDVPEKSAVAILPTGIKVAIPMAGLIDIDAELTRLAKEKDKLTKELEKLEAKFTNPDFAERAPQEIIEKDRSQIAELKKRLIGYAEFEKRLASYRCS